MKFVEYFRNLDSKKQTLIAGALVITLAGGSIALKVHHEKVNPSTSPVSAGEIDDKDKMISQQQLNAQKTKNKSKSNSSSNELVPYNLNGRLGSLGGGYNSTPLSLGGDYSYTPTVEPTVYEPIIEPVEDEIIEETDTPTVSEPIVNEVVKPVVPNEVVASQVTAPIPNEEGVAEGIEEDNVLDIINSAGYKGKRIVFFVEKYLQCEPTYDYLEEDNKQILTVNGNGLFIRFEKVGGSDYECAKITLNGQDRRDLLDTIFELNEGTSGYVPSAPPEPSIIETPAPDKPVEPEQPKDDKVETEDNVINPDTNTDNNTGVTAPPVTAPPEEQEVVVG